ncbi:hypothetical protein V1478_013821 [Vespula squamosa]|uniref:Uncharacterized protein n=1 Tax=Vespula squamosa TaxID=30214 RepID=A0ABD2A6B1_VESSQ
MAGNLQQICNVHMGIVILEYVSPLAIFMYRSIGRVRMSRSWSLVIVVIVTGARIHRTRNVPLKLETLSGLYLHLTCFPWQTDPVNLASTQIAPVTPLHATANSQREFGPVESGHSYDHPSRIFHLLSLLARLHAFTHPQTRNGHTSSYVKSNRTIEMIVFERHFSRKLGRRRRNEKRFCGRTCNGSTLPVGSFRDVDDNDGSGRGRHSSSRGGGTSRACLRTEENFRDIENNTHCVDRMKLASRYSLFSRRPTQNLVESGRTKRRCEETDREKVREIEIEIDKSGGLAIQVVYSRSDATRKTNEEGGFSVHVPSTLECESPRLYSSNLQKTGIWGRLKRQLKNFFSNAFIRIGKGRFVRNEEALAAISVTRRGWCGFNKGKLSFEDAPDKRRCTVNRDRYMATYNCHWAVVPAALL